MVKNAAEGKEDVRSVNAEQGSSHTELLIFGNSNNLVYSTSRVTAPSSTELHYILHSSLYGQNSRSYTSTPRISRNLSKQLKSIVARSLNSKYYMRNTTFQQVLAGARLNMFQFDI